MRPASHPPPHPMSAPSRGPRLETASFGPDPPLSLLETEANRAFPRSRFLFSFFSFFVRHPNYALPHRGEEKSFPPPPLFLYSSLHWSLAPCGVRFSRSLATGGSPPRCTTTLLLLAITLQIFAPRHSNPIRSVYSTPGEKREGKKSRGYEKLPPTNGNVHHDLGGNSSLSLPSLVRPPQIKISRVQSDAAIKDRPISPSDGEAQLGREKRGRAGTRQ